MKTSGRVILLIFSAFFFFALLRLALPLYLNELGFSFFYIGLIVASRSLMVALFSIPIGRLSDQFGAKLVSTLGMILLSLSFLGFYFFRGVIEITLSSLAVGFSWTIIENTSAVMASAIFSSQGKSFGLFTTTVQAGSLVGSATAGMLLYAADFNIVFLFGLIASTPITICLHLLWPPRKKTVKRQKTFTKAKSKKLQGILGPSVIVSLLSIFFAYLQLGAFNGFFSIYIKSIGMNEAIIGLLVASEAGISLSTRLPTGILCDRIGRKITFILSGLALSSLGIFPLGFLRVPASVVIFIAFFSIGRGIVSIGTLSYMAKSAGAGQLGSAVGVANSVRHFGNSVGPVAMGFLVSSLGFNNGFLLAGTAGFIVVIIAFILLLGSKSLRTSYS